MANGGNVGLNLVALEVLKVILGANTPVGRITPAQNLVDGSVLRLDGSGVDVLLKDDNVAVWNNILSMGVLNL